MRHLMQDVRNFVKKRTPYVSCPSVPDRSSESEIINDLADAIGAKPDELELILRKAIRDKNEEGLGFISQLMMLGRMTFAVDDINELHRQIDEFSQRETERFLEELGKYQKWGEERDKLRVRLKKMTDVIFSEIAQVDTNHPTKRQYAILASLYNIDTRRDYHMVYWSVLVAWYQKNDITEKVKSLHVDPYQCLIALKMIDDMMDKPYSFWKRAIDVGALNEDMKNHD